MRISLIFVCLWSGLVGANPNSQTSIRLNSERYVNQAAESFRAGAEGQDSSIGIGLKREFRAPHHIKFQVELSDHYSSVEQWNYLNIYQAFLTAPGAADIQISAGRKLELWSQIEKDWNLGVFQPRYMQNKMRQESAGLTGFFFSGGSQKVKATVALLPIYIPEMGAHFSVQNDKFVSANPWFDPPASQFIYRDVIHDIRYSVQRPPVDQIVGHPGVAAKIEGSWARFSASYKPVPQLRLAFPSVDRAITTVDGTFLDIEIQPQVTYHRVLAGEFFGHWRGWNFTAGAIFDEPESGQAKEGFTSQTFASGILSSVMATHAIGDEGVGAPRIFAGASKLFSGQGRDQGEFTQEKSLFEGRWQFFEAYQVGAYFPIRHFTRRPIEARAQVIWDRMQNGALLRSELSHEVIRNLTLDGAADFLGLLGSSAEVTDEFLNNYRANDRVSLGMTYVF